MLTVLCVLRSGGEYTAELVHRLQRAVARHLSVPHRFASLSDVAVPGVDWIQLKHDWPGWWSKIELFRPGVVNGPTLYLDLDTVLVGSIDKLADLPHDFAIMRNFNMPHMPGSAVMWFKDKAPAKVYEAFADDPDYYIGQYSDRTQGCYLGDQAFIWDVLDRKVKYLSDDVPGLIRSYRRHCASGAPEGCAVVAFGGDKKPWNVADQWVKESFHA